MDRFENHVSNKRNSGLDSFLRKNLGHSGYIRYYEKCVVESKGGSFLHSYLVLTDERILVTQNPPKNLTHSIPLSQVLDIKLVPERHSVVIGAGPNVITSQHVYVVSAGCQNSKSNPKSRTTLSLKNHSPSSEKGAFQLPSSIMSEYLPIAMAAVVHEKTHNKIPNLVHEEEFGESDSSRSMDISVDSDLSPTFRSSSVLEQNLSSWRIENKNEIMDVPKRPNSVDETQLLTQNGRKRILGRYFSIRTKEKGKLDKVREDEKTEYEINEAHFHLYEAHSIFLNELFLYWDRQIMKITSNPMSPCFMASGPRLKGAPNHVILEDIVEAAEKTASLIRLDSRFMYNRKARAHVYSFACDLNQDLQNSQMVRLCFQNARLTSSLMALLKFCTSILNSSAKSEGEPMHPKSFQEFLQIQLMLLEIFRVLIQVNTGTGYYNKHEGVISFDRKGSVDWRFIIESLIKLITLDEIYSGNDVLSNPHKFSKCEWKDHSVISTMVVKFNVSVSLLYEIISLFLHTPGDQHAIADLLRNGNITRLASKSVTQIFNLVTPTKSMEMTPAHCILLYQHIYVLRNLMNNAGDVTLFIRENYYEEFKYFVHDRGIRERIPAECRIKAKILEGVTSIRTEILRNPMEP